MKTIITLVLAISLSWTCSASAVAEDTRPNILWIIADDLSQDLGCYGAKAVRTPNIDKLAKQGTRYDYAFATAPACSPSRTALITGLYQTTLGGHQHRTRNKPALPDGVRLLTEYFRDAGYFVCNGNSGLSGAGKGDYNLKLGKGVYDGRDWRQREEGQPFFAQVQVYEPHRPLVRENDASRARQIDVPPYLPDHPIVRQDWANYLASVEVLDRKVGKVLERLKADGLEKNTIVMFFGDHGRPQYRNKQWLYDGGIRVPLIIRWPGTIKPGSVDKRLVSLLDLAPTCLATTGIDVPDHMQGKDVFSKNFSGRDVIYAARDRSGDAIERIRCVRDKRYKYIRNYTHDRPYGQWSSYLAVHYPVFTLMHVLKEKGQLGPNQQWFIRDTKPKEELYDLEQDPFELNNLADDPAHKQRLIKMSTLLDVWVEETSDRGAEVEGDEAYFEELFAGKMKWYRSSQKKRGLSPDVSREDYLRWWAEKLEVR